MSLAISFGDFEDEQSVSGAIYFNAVTTYNRKYSGRVSEHPLEMGSKITDHYSAENTKYQIEGVISGVEISHIPSNIILEEQPVINNQSQPDLVSTNDTAGGLMSYIPEVITQFIPPLQSLSVNMDGDTRDNKNPEIEALMEQLMTGLYYSEERATWENRMTPVILYELDGYSITKSVGDLVITDFTINEDAESGEGMFFSMSLEQVKFVTLEETDAPSPQKGSSTDIKNQPTQNRGSQSPEPDEFVITPTTV